MSEEEDEREPILTYMMSRIYTGPGAMMQLAGVDAEDIVGKGPVVVQQETNDDNDDGYPDGQVETWWLRFETLEAAIAQLGYTRRGAYGQPVDVCLNGEPLHQPLESIDSPV